MFKIKIAKAKLQLKTVFKPQPISTNHKPDALPDQVLPHRRLPADRPAHRIDPCGGGAEAEDV